MGWGGIDIFWNHTIQNTYTLFDGLTYNTRGYFASCIVKCPLVLYDKPSNKGFIIPLKIRV